MVQADIVEVIPRIEGGVADKLKHTAMHSVRAGAGDDIGVTGGAVANLGRHHAGAGLHFLDGVDIEVGKSRAAHFRVGGVGSVECEDGRATALAVHGKLLRKIRGAVGVGHGARGEKQQLAEVARIQRQTGNFSGRKMFAATGLLSRRAFFLEKHQTFFRRRQFQSGGEFGSVLNI